MHDNQPPLLVVVIMVKNESLAIESTLLPFVNNGINHICVFDTGSTDSTIEIVTSFFQKHKLKGWIKQEPFIDFSTSRNRALDLAEETFPDSSFMIMPDSEWFLQNPKALIAFLEKNENYDTPMYLMKLSSHKMEFFTARIFRTVARVRFSGVVHEVPSAPSSIKIPPDTYFKWRPSDQGNENSKLRWQRDAELLLEEYKKNPNDPRIAFYLAQTYDYLDELETALKYYKIRENINGWDEENFITVLRIGTTLEKLSQQNNQYTWTMAYDYYIKAYKMRPQRIEPLIKIAEHYFPDNIPLCFIYVIQAYRTPYSTDMLFVEKEMYSYRRYEILSRCAWYLNEFKIGREATKRALKIHPDMTHLKRNLKLYDTRCHL